jgi:hypothetical protein
MCTVVLKGKKKHRSVLLCSLHLLAQVAPKRTLDQSHLDRTMTTGGGVLLCRTTRLEQMLAGNVLS